jgi:hypothetical protein
MIARPGNNLSRLSEFQVQFLSRPNHRCLLPFAFSPDNHEEGSFLKKLPEAQGQLILIRNDVAYVRRTETQPDIFALIGGDSEVTGMRPWPGGTTISRSPPSSVPKYSFHSGYSLTRRTHTYAASGFSDWESFLKNPSGLPRFSGVACNKFEAPLVRLVFISVAHHSTERLQERENLPHGVGFLGG